VSDWLQGPNIANRRSDIHNFFWPLAISWVGLHEIRVRTIATMSVDTFVFIRDENLPTMRQWQAALDRADTGIALESIEDLRVHIGYLPANYRGMNPVLNGIMARLSIISVTRYRMGLAIVCKSSTSSRTVTCAN
jgi:hypothetical protein